MRATKASTAGRRAAVKTIKITAIVVAATCLGWLVVVNLALWTGFVSWVVSGERERSTIRLDHGWAWCVWPTRVHINDLHLAIDTYKWQLELDVPEAQLHTSLLALLDRHFHAKSLTGDGAELAFAFKLQDGIDDLDRIEAFKVIEGLPRPVRPDEPPPRRSPEEAWLVELQSVSVGVQRIWIDELEGRIDGRLSGGMQFMTGYLFAVPSVRLDVIGGELNIGDHPMASAITGSLEVELAAYDPRSVEGRPVLRQVSGRVLAVAALDEIRWTRLYSNKLQVRGGAGSVFASAHLSGGMFMPGSMVDLRTRQIELAMRDMTIEADAHARATAEQTTKGRRARLDMTVTGVRGTGESGEQAWLRIPTMDLRAVWGTTDLVTRPWTIVDGSAEIPSFRIANLGAIDWPKSKATLRSGAVAGHASAQVSPDSVDLDFAVDAQRVEVEAGKTHVGTDGYLRAKGSIDRKSKSVVLEPVRAKLRNLEIRTPKGHTGDTWVEVDRARLVYAPEDRTIRASLRGRLEDLKPVIAHARYGSGILEQLVDLEMGGPVDYAVRIRRTPASMLVRVPELDGGGIDARAIWARSGDRTRAAILLQRAAVGIVVEGDSRDVELAEGDAWYAAKARWVEALTHTEATPGTK